MPNAQPIEWTSQHRFLWTGRRNGLPAGTIEHGAHFTYIDVTGIEHHGYATLLDAQHAAEQLGPDAAFT